MNLAQQLKKKRDSEKRLEQSSPAKVFTEVVAGEPSYNDLSGFATKKQLAELEITDLADANINYLGNAGKALIVNENEDGMILGEGGSGGIIEIPQATETTLGGIKAKARTTESNEIAIDEVTGKLYSQIPSGAAVNNENTGLPLLFWVGTETEYKLIEEPDLNTLYFRSDN